MYTPVREFFIMNIIKKVRNSSIFRPIMAGIIFGLCLFIAIMPQASNARFDSMSAASYVAKAANETAHKVVKKVVGTITAYSSTPGQTDDTPFTTASGKHVADGVIANNGLPLGTKVKIPDLYGDKVFVVEDRMNKRMGTNRFDIWMPSTTSALHFGVQKAEIEVLN